MTRDWCPVCEAPADVLDTHDEETPAGVPVDVLDLSCSHQLITKARTRCLP